MLDRSCGFIHHGLGRSAFLGQTVAPFSRKAYARSETLLSVEAAHPGPLDLNLGLIGWRYGLMKRLAVNSLNLMERDRKFCIAEERAAGPCLKHVPRP
jgi:hypothetical protein